MKRECICPIRTCLKEFISAKILERHLQRFHTDKSVLQHKDGEEPGMELSGKDETTEHKALDLSGTQSDARKSTRFQCEFCHIEFSDQNRCKMHEVNAHKRKNHAIYEDSGSKTKSS